MRTIPRFVATLAAIALITPSLARAEDALTRRDSRGPVTVTATLLPPGTADTATRIRIAFNTHSVELDGLAFDRVVALRSPDGKDVAPTAVEATGSGHHRSAVLSFPSPPAGVALRVVVRDVGGVAERVFTWDRPATR